MIRNFRFTLRAIVIAIAFWSFSGASIAQKADAPSSGGRKGETSDQGGDEKSGKYRSDDSKQSGNGKFSRPSNKDGPQQLPDENLPQKDDLEPEKDAPPMNDLEREGEEDLPEKDGLQPNPEDESVDDDEPVDKDSYNVPRGGSKSGSNQPENDSESDDSGDELENEPEKSSPPSTKDLDDGTSIKA